MMAEVRSCNLAVCLVLGHCWVWLGSSASAAPEHAVSLPAAVSVQRCGLGYGRLASMCNESDFGACVFMDTVW